MPKLLPSRGALCLESSLLRIYLRNSSLAALPLRTKEVEFPYFVQNFLLALLAYMESAATQLTLAFISFCCMRIQSFRCMPSLKALNERGSMNGMPSICCCQPSNRTRRISFPCLLRWDVHNNEAVSN